MRIPQPVEILDILDTTSNLLPCVYLQFLTREITRRYSYVLRRSILFILPPNNEIITVIELTHQLILKNLACFSLFKKFATFRKLIAMFARTQYIHY
jgi:hypothetical protein